MKKFFLFIIFLILLSSVYAIPDINTDLNPKINKPLIKNLQQQKLQGDLNNDGKITSLDALITLQMAVGKIPKNNEADINNDGKINSRDALQILNLSLYYLEQNITLNLTNQTFSNISSIIDLFKNTDLSYLFEDELIQAKIKNKNYFIVIENGKLKNVYTKQPKQKITLYTEIPESVLNEISKSDNIVDTTLNMIANKKIKLQGKTLKNKIKISLINTGVKIYTKVKSFFSF